MYGSDSIIEDGSGTVHPGGDNCGHALKMKETTGDHFQGTDLSGADGRDKSAPLHRENEASFTFDVCPSNSPSEGKTSKDCQSFPSIQVDEVQLICLYLVLYLAEPLISFSNLF